MVPAMSCNFYLVKNHQIDDNSATAEAKEKISKHLESLEFERIFDACLTKLEKLQIVLHKISHRFLVTTKLFSG